MAEYRVEVDHSAVLAALRIEVELRPDAPPDAVARIDEAVREELLFRAEILVAAPGSLPRFEMKARRFVVEDETR